MHFTRNLVFSMFFIIISFFQFCSSAIALDGQIALFPFEINSEKNLSFLEKGIFEMLSAKIKAEKLAIVKIEQENVLKIDDILRIAKEKNVKYAISGSLIIFGNTLNISAFLYDTESGESIIAFNKSDSNKDNLFSHINTFADEVLQKIKTPVAEAVEKPRSTPAKSVESSNNNQKPTTNNQQPTTGILKTPLFKSENIEEAVISFTTGDVDGDGMSELVFTTGSEIFVSTYKNGEFKIKKTIKGKHYLKNISLDIIDTNNNGISEIFITSVHRTSKFVQSFVVEWDGKDYVETIENSGWFFAASALKKNGDKLLIGQKQHFAERIFGKAVYELSFDKSENEYIAGKKIKLPEFANIYNFTFGDVMNKDINNIVSFGSGGKLVVYDDKHVEVWRSSSSYGGSVKYLEPRKGDNQRRFYFSSRIIADDIDNDSSTEIVTIQNYNSNPSIFVNMKNYTDANITCLFWDSLTLETKWKTQTVSGYIPDFNISDIDGDGKKDLIYCVVEKVGSFWKTKQTYFVIQPIN